MALNYNRYAREMLEETIVRPQDDDKIEMADIAQAYIRAMADDPVFVQIFAELLENVHKQMVNELLQSTSQ